MHAYTQNARYAMTPQDPSNAEPPRVMQPQFPLLNSANCHAQLPGRKSFPNFQFHVAIDAAWVSSQASGRRYSVKYKAALNSASLNVESIRRSAVSSSNH
eukprot:8960823-Pyramimonas_sp.AAC.1